MSEDKIVNINRLPKDKRVQHGKPPKTVLQKMEAKGATVETKTMVDHTPAQEEARRMLIRAGKMIEPGGFQYQGSAVVHFYQGTMKEDDAVFITMAPFEKDFSEVQAYAGFQELQNKLMAAFGRKG